MSPRFYLLPVQNVGKTLDWEVVQILQPWIILVQNKINNQPSKTQV
jgi:hypothetical protein